jgi:hypothetical protein
MLLSGARRELVLGAFKQVPQKMMGGLILGIPDLASLAGTRSGDALVITIRNGGIQPYEEDEVDEESHRT